MTDKTEQRLHVLEEHVSDLQKTVDDLNEIITKQWNDMDELRRNIARLTEELAEFEQQSDGVGRVTKPPHY